MLQKSKAVTSWENVPVIIDLPYACRIVGKSYDGLKKLCANGKFPAFKVGGEWRVDKDQLKAFIEGSWESKGQNLES